MMPLLIASIFTLIYPNAFSAKLGTGWQLEHWITPLDELITFRAKNQCWKMLSFYNWTSK